jgi:hypothetical protein
MRLVVLGLLASLVALTLAACGDRVAVEPPSTASPTGSPGSTFVVCGSLHDGLPDAVVGQQERETTPNSTSTAAWGDPAITLRCGVDRPSAMQPTSSLISVDGVAWLPEELTHGYVFTTYGRVAYVEVTVPDDYAPEGEVLTTFADAVKATDPKTPSPTPTGSP